EITTTFIVIASFLTISSLADPPNLMIGEAPVIGLSARLMIVAFGTREKQSPLGSELTSLLQLKKKDARETIDKIIAHVQLSEEDISELKEFAISGGYQQQITGSFFYTNFKVRFSYFNSEYLI
ncbi:hypothetical protein ACJX0J_016582, partial [Zea mays]